MIIVKQGYVGINHNSMELRLQPLCCIVCHQGHELLLSSSLLLLCFAIVDKQGLFSHSPFGNLLLACLSCIQCFISLMAILSLLSSFPSPLFSYYVMSLLYTCTHTYYMYVNTLMHPYICIHTFISQSSVRKLLFVFVVLFCFY